ncbi:NAD(P)H quinone oxidoreductase [Actinorhabdospora filicis]|uniref:NAD(P)H quinone oxidoreductase n=1 Tax=Actinorhabdospora filicis TaxID=1785913 RepID=A0A9W6SS68_9ACTN|nr:NAD(P)H-quinone oxidoreductase [Actinorhabdospora filicis]GLZ81378.1 NAD(P)H quinone oxidoreductase [Actinorhabdospora filicis]
MRAVVVRDGELSWGAVADPEVGEGEVLIRVAAAGVNRADLLQRRGLYPAPVGAPAGVGLECSGEVVAVGPGVTRRRVGERVCALLQNGAYAELVAVHEGLTMSIPAGLSIEDAAGVPEVACTVWSNVFEVARLQPGESLLVHGGAGGIGTFAIQLGVAKTARVFTTARKENHADLRELGAEVTIDYRDGDFVSVVQGLGGADVILDNIGAANLAGNIDALAPDGRIAVIGFQGGRHADVDLARLMGKRGTLYSAGLRQRPLHQRVSIVEATERGVWPHYADGTIRAVTSERVPMSEAGRAHDLLDAGGNLGKVLLIPG